MAGLFVVEQVNGPAYDRSRPRREQDGWDEHARFMDALVERGTILLGGPVGDVNGEGTLLVVRAENEAEIRAAFAPDPWYESVLHLARIEPWTLWLGNLDESTK